MGAGEQFKYAGEALEHPRVSGKVTARPPPTVLVCATLASTAIPHVRPLAVRGIAPQKRTEVRGHTLAAWFRIRHRLVFWTWRPLGCTDGDRSLVRGCTAERPRGRDPRQPPQAQQLRARPHVSRVCRGRAQRAPGAQVLWQIVPIPSEPPPDRGEPQTGRSCHQRPTNHKGDVSWHG